MLWGDSDRIFRPDTTSCLVHPFFWDAERRLAFLQDASDRFEIMCREPREERLFALETNASNVVGQDWRARLDKSFQENLGKFRKYDGKSVQDLLRALRNKVRGLCHYFYAEGLTDRAEASLSGPARESSETTTPDARGVSHVLHASLPTTIHARS